MYEIFLQIIPYLFHIIDTISGNLMIHDNEQCSENHLIRCFNLRQSFIVVVKKLVVFADFSLKLIIWLFSFFNNFP